MRFPKYKTRRRYETLGELRFLTFSCYHHLPLFNNDAIKDEFVRALDAARKRTECRIIAWVVMPDHAHLLVAPSLPRYPVPVFLKYLKGAFASKVLQENGNRVTRQRHFSMSWPTLSGPRTASPRL